MSGSEMFRIIETAFQDHTTSTDEQLKIEELLLVNPRIAVKDYADAVNTLKRSVTTILN